MRTLKALSTAATTLLAVATLATPAAAVAGNAAGPEQIPFHYTGADLATPAGLERTYQRIARSAELACQRHAGRELSRQRVYQRCREASVAAAVQAIQDPRLTALHGSRAQRPMVVAGLVVRADGR